MKADDKVIRRAVLADRRLVRKVLAARAEHFARRAADAEPHVMERAQARCDEANACLAVLIGQWREADKAARKRRNTR